MAEGGLGRPARSNRVGPYRDREQERAERHREEKEGVEHLQALAVRLSGWPAWGMFLVLTVLVIVFATRDNPRVALAIPFFTVPGLLFVLAGKLFGVGKKQEE